MRLCSCIVFCLLLNVGFASAADGKKTLKSSTSCSSLSASGNSEYPPFLWRETPTSARLLGINRLILDEVSRRIGIPITLSHVGPWSRAQTEVKNGRVDLMAGAFYTNERANYMDYFAPVMLHTTSVVWQHKGKAFPFNKKEDLEGKWGVTVINNSFGQEFDQYAQRHLNILSVASLSQALRMLAADRVDYVLYEKNPAHAYASLLGLSDIIVPVLPYISSEGLYLTMSKKSPCNTSDLKYRIAIALQSMKQDGFTEKALHDGVLQWQARDHVSLLEE
ncbi:transporter substrate-binding domain-containing protein [Marinomonas sp. M1K-6]|uniref:Transporter substrate-binding domain-containing protein n=1 Tax=Marinomonas profundi TaxID=2726122 RepID=A0A847R847_9GAMM|nr:transporter substrate-binding domain-containing protein [Marinomonas profundi]NLQ18246.1 transporter substrate-binding domain-containing protein [Marinomonas profundi]UDV03597.1 transporter substrate-binding domain-containing protein [Marinomonas profundi]